MRKEHKEIYVEGKYSIPTPPCKQCEEGPGKLPCDLLAICKAWAGAQRGTVVQFNLSGRPSAVRASISAKLIELDLYDHGEDIVRDINRGTVLHVYCKPSNSVILNRVDA